MLFFTQFEIFFVQILSIFIIYNSYLTILFYSFFGIKFNNIFQIIIKIFIYIHILQDPPTKNFINTTFSALARPLQGWPLMLGWVRLDVRKLLGSIHPCYLGPEVWLVVHWPVGIGWRGRVWTLKWHGLCLMAFPATGRWTDGFRVSETIHNQAANCSMLIVLYIADLVFLRVKVTTTPPLFLVKYS